MLCSLLFHLLLALLLSPALLSLLGRLEGLDLLDLPVHPFQISFGLLTKGYSGSLGSDFYARPKKSLGWGFLQGLADNGLWLPDAQHSKATVEMEQYYSPVQAEVWSLQSETAHYKHEN